MDAEDFLEPSEWARSTQPHLEYKDACDGCGGPLTWVDAAWICSHECTWCTECAESHAMACPNCGGPLQQRPRRTRPVGR